MLTFKVANFVLDFIGIGLVSEPIQGILHVDNILGDVNVFC